MVRLKKRMTGFLLACLLFCSGGLSLLPVQAETLQVTTETEETADTTPSGNDELEYEEYIVQYGSIPLGDASFTLKADSAICEANGPVAETDEDGQSLLRFSGTNTGASWTVTVPADGLYAMRLDYLALEGKGMDIRMAVELNGEMPFRQAGNFVFTRRFRDVFTETGDFEQDNNGNEIKPKTEEIFLWQTAAFTDADGMYDSPLLFYFREGENTLRLVGIEEPVAVREVGLYIPEELPTYAELSIEPTTVQGATPELVRIEAEKMSWKSRSSISTSYDRSTPATLPYHPSKIRINTMGGSQWKSSGDKVEWNFTVEKSGYYAIGARYRQNTVRGFYVSRKITVDGQPVCEELNEQRFYYDINWRTENFSDGTEDIVLWFDEGQHTISMEVTLGSMEETIRTLMAAQTRLNEMYRKIIMITSVQPDPYRDYTLQTDIPELLSVFSNVAEQLEQESKRLEEVTGQSGSEAALIDRLAEQLRSFVDKPHTIAERLTKYRENVSGLMEWVNSIKSQPLELDYLYLCPYGMEKPEAGAGFWAQLKHEIRAFLGTFIEDYSSIGGNENGENIEVWVSTGRDMAYIVNRQVQSSFTAENDVGVTLKLVNAGLLQAVMAGQEPDVALGLGRGVPVNLAMRDALYPISEFADYQEVTSWFHKSAMIPYQYASKAYALPEQQTFHMMFVRTDILDELGLDIPETWDDIYKIVRVLQRNNLQIGLPYLTTDANNLVSTGLSAQNIYPTLLGQRGGSIFNAEGSATALDTPEALEAFDEWVGFYTQYSFPLLKDDYNRFRTGEMPITITNYTFYNQLVMAAPEIRDEWQMVPIPGTRLEDGSINRTEYASGTACVIFANSDNPEAAWKFLRWWVSADTQAEYGLMAEALLGPTGRYATANLEAFDRLPWSTQDAQIIREQWEQVSEIPEIPGGYYVARNLDNAFRACVYRQENTREMLSYWNKSSNEEIKRKREEFGLQ